jgi:hypothetical protein
MLTEQDVVNYTADFLGAAGYEVSAARGPRQRGRDIEAVDPSSGLTLLIEAKGETASSPKAGSFGRPFSNGTIYSSVCTAYFCASVYVGEGHDAGIALPDCPRYRKQIQAILPSISKLGIKLYWVQSDGRVLNQ